MTQALNAGDTLLITGGSGFLGWNLARRLPTPARIVLTHHHHAVPDLPWPSLPLDLGRVGAVEALMRDVRPAAVVHTAAMTSPDACEDAPQRAWDINTEGTRRVARAAQAVGARLVHCSTDLVFDGEGSHYREEDVPRPLSLYGRSKLQGEQEALSACDEAWVLRLAVMFGQSNGVNPSFSDWLLRRVAQGQDAPLFTDEYRSILWVGDAVAAVAAVLRRLPPRQLYHVGGPRRMTRLAFGEALARTIPLSGASLRGVPMAAVPQRAPRPRDCSMDCRRAQEDLAFSPAPFENPPWRRELAETFHRLQEGGSN